MSFVAAIAFLIVGRRTCRDAVLEAMLRLEGRGGRDVFDLYEIVSEVEANGTHRAETIRTQVVSAMCATAPVHHANHTDDLERVDRGRYRLTVSGRAAAQGGRSGATPRPPMASTLGPRALPGSPGSTQEDWFWEGNVQGAVVRNLEETGWTVQRQADTATRERGADIVATRNDEMLVVEVKGFPSHLYARGAAAGTPKPTQPATQARVWFSSCLLSGMLLRHRYPRAMIVLAFPDFTTYRSLIERVEPSLSRLGFGVLLVNESGAVEHALSPESTD